MQNTNYDDYNFESIEDFKYALVCGREILFKWNDVTYAGFNDSEAYEANDFCIIDIAEPDTELRFDSIEKVLDFKLSGTPLREVVTKVEVLDRIL